MIVNLGMAHLHHTVDTDRPLAIAPTDRLQDMVHPQDMAHLRDMGRRRGMGHHLMDMVPRRLAMALMADTPLAHRATAHLRVLHRATAHLAPPQAASRVARTGPSSPSTRSMASASSTARRSGIVLAATFSSTRLKLATWKLVRSSASCWTPTRTACPRRGTSDALMDPSLDLGRKEKKQRPMVTSQQRNDDEVARAKKSQTTAQAERPRVEMRQSPRMELPHRSLKEMQRTTPRLRLENRRRQMPRRKPREARKTKPRLRLRLRCLQQTQQRRRVPRR
mmetsp:Transcript_20722/g.48426  ORF Transcript_20722/g.48426 Transcript_20722/m.48426 type:complete len:279 (+) Transcript_20722:373-1209(+)